MLNIYVLYFSYGEKLGNADKIKDGHEWLI